MKKVILMLFCLPIMLFGQNVSIPDTNFKAYLVGNSVINTNGDTEIQLSEANSFNGSIICNSLNINDLTGIEAFISLSILNCENNQLTSLNVSQNINLVDLECNNNQIISLDLSNNFALIDLECDYNQLTSLDVSNNPNLIYLSCSFNQISILDVSQNISLLGIICGNNQISTLDVSNNPALNTFKCSNNQLSSLDINANISLMILECYNNQLTSLDLSNNVSLMLFSCNNNQLTYLDLRNGNNINFISFYAYSNPNLSCISVDDSLWATSNWSVLNMNIDPAMFFSADCSTISCVQPQTIFSSSIGLNSATFNWDAVAGAHHYDIRWREQGNSIWNLVTPVLSNTQSLMGFIQSTNYDWEVRSACSTDSSSVSVWSSTEVFATADPCAIPANESTSNITSSSATFIWDAVPGAWGYIIRIAEITNLGSWTYDTVNTNTFDPTGLSASTTYLWQVKSTCDSIGSNVSVWSVSNNIFTTLALGVCSGPSNLDTLSVGVTSVSLEWDTVSTAWGYVVRYMQVGTSSAWNYDTVNTNTFTLTGLNTNTTYNWCVATLCDSSGNNISTWSCSYFNMPFCNFIWQQAFTICEGESIIVGGNVYDTTGSYIDTLVVSNGCDTIMYTNVNMLPSIISQQSFTICQGDSVMVGGNIYDTTGSYTDTLFASNGCDSIVYTNINLLPFVIWQQAFTICEGESIIVGSNFYDTTGYYLDTLSAFSSCDTIMYTNILVNMNTVSYDTVSSTNVILWNGMYLSISGDYSYTLTNSLGCDSIANINLTITPTSILDVINANNKIIKIANVLNQEMSYRKRMPLFYLYEDGRVEKKIIIE